MSPLERFLSKEEKIIEFDLNKEINEGDQLFVISQNIYIIPQVEATYSGFKVHGTPRDSSLPLFIIEVDCDKKKVVAEIKGEKLPLDCKDKISDILKKYF